MCLFHNYITLINITLINRLSNASMHLYPKPNVMLYNYLLSLKHNTLILQIFAVTGINLHMITPIVCLVCIFYTTLVSICLTLIPCSLRIVTHGYPLKRGRPSDYHGRNWSIELYCVPHKS